MRPATIRSLLVVLLIALVAGWLAWPTNTEIDLSVLGVRFHRDIAIKEGLDLRGGIQVLLQAEVASGQVIDPDTMIAARRIIENRVNALGVSEPVIQLGQGNRIIVELPGVKDPDQAIKTFGNTGLLEFIDAGASFLPPGTSVTTSLGGPTAEIAPITDSPEKRVFQTIVQGKHLTTANVGFDELGRPEIQFAFGDEGAKFFGDFTTANVGRYLAITLDKQVISSPVIQSPIVGGSGRITGGGPRGFALEEAQNIVIQLKYGALPVPLKVVQNRTVGPTLGQDSVRKSVVAGLVGLGIVAGFMVLNYRAFGVLATMALVVYAAITFALFKTIPIVITLAGIAGFILSIGMAVDANILIFERMKEELRTGRSLNAAIDAGFARAWTSIRDSNVSTLITCAILFWFGANFGASIIQGFALTLAIGVVVSMFTAITVTRTLLHVLRDVRFLPSSGVFGLAQRTVRV
ncbi:MAG: protein translocase subunit SecD [Chloroflexota bacterium]|nr:MAG: protein translocase subunit SecD [Chloroflexota bacterium]